MIRRFFPFRFLVLTNFGSFTWQKVRLLDFGDDLRMVTRHGSSQPFCATILDPAFHSNRLYVPISSWTSLGYPCLKLQLVRIRVYAARCCVQKSNMKRACGKQGTLGLRIQGWEISIESVVVRPGLSPSLELGKILRKVEIQKRYPPCNHRLRDFLGARSQDPSY